jgi:hypothetical protein
VKDKNIVVSIHQDNFRRALRAVREFGPTQRSPHHNVLAMMVENPYPSDVKIGLLSRDLAARSPPIGGPAA